MIKCAIVGATGLVGTTFLKVLEEKKLNIDEFVLFASKKSEGKEIKFMDKTYVIKELNEENIRSEEFNYALFSAGAEVSKKYAKVFAENGCIVIDNSSYFRLNDDVPLVVPEVNMSDAFNNKGIIANPNCSTIQMMLPLKALDDKFGIKRVVCSTYQAVSGAGISGLTDLRNKEAKKFPYKIANNCIPQIDVFLENDYTKEEMKMIEESKKILHRDDLKITATCVRVPIENSHSESINITLKKEFYMRDIIECLSNFENIILLNDNENLKYPLNEIANGTDNVYVGRIRRDYSEENTINIWVVADNIRKGAASNAVQILERLLK